MRRGWVFAGAGLALALVMMVAVWTLVAGPGPGPSPEGARSDELERHSHSHSQSRRAQVEERPTEEPLEAPGLPTRVVGGALVDPESGPLGAGRIDLWCDDGRLLDRVQVDEEGRFVARACAGSSCARLTHPVFDQPEAWVLEPGTIPELEVAAAPGIVGRIASARGEPVPDASLLLRSPDGRRATARSDVDGAFALFLPGLRPCDPCDGGDGGDGGDGSEAREGDGGASGCHDPSRAGGSARARLLAMAPGFAPLEIEVTLETQPEGGQELDLRLAPPAAPIRGRVLDRDGIPFGSRAIVLATHLEREAEQHAAQVDARGEFELRELGEGIYRLRALRDGRELATHDAAAPGEDVELRAKIPARLVALKLELRDAEGRPVAGARVDGGPFRGAKSDTRGRVEADEVLPGTYTLRVRAADCPAQRIELELGAAQPGQPQLPGAPEIVVLPPTCG